MNWDAGLRWAAGMLGLDTVELIAFSHILLLDRDRAMLIDGSVDAVEIYAIALVATIFMQILGMLLVRWKHYRTGGALQIIASAPHVIKLEGVIGVIGGLEAWRYPRTQTTEAGLQVHEPLTDSDVSASRSEKSPTAASVFS